ncbi:DNA polymerase III subunit epsilon [Mariprofundus erugo]|uniref:3'-5' exonuclease n=1 Tax=Mariprofundus erugo TaxID=2528639 RepID=UPI0010FCEA41|nr:3'-5' exonuclease [Mariprofundus erugo]TLS76659.1 DNA polymerase III subunit epsilon [Mariprofundus erugo]
MNDTDAIEHLQKSGRYRVLERLNPPARYLDGAPSTARIGLVVDTETTGIDTARDKIIELGFVAFSYDAASGQVYQVLHAYDGSEDPGEPLSDVVKQLTGISDAMVAGQHLNDDEITHWLAQADLLIAHNAAFDRQMIERRFPLVREKNWACTLMEIDWQAEGIGSRKLDYIAFCLGYFFDGHRAVIDAQATLHLLTRQLPQSGQRAMQALLLKAREKSKRFFAIGAPFEMKDQLRQRGYNWLADAAFTDRSGHVKKGVWSKVVAMTDVAAEELWLGGTVYAGRAVTYSAREISAQDRYSVREFLPDAG